MKTWVIEFRNGNFFQYLEADRGGPIHTARRFDSKEEAEALMIENPWIFLNGGMAFEAQIDCQSAA